MEFLADIESEPIMDHIWKLESSDSFASLSSKVENAFMDGYHFNLYGWDEDGTLQDYTNLPGDNRSVDRAANIDSEALHGYLTSISKSLSAFEARIRHIQ
jgi:hypothetical protein